jgi:hypothetical protein
VKRKATYRRSSTLIYLSFRARTETNGNQENMLLTNTKEPDRTLPKDMVAKHYKSTEHN